MNRRSIALLGVGAALVIATGASAAMSMAAQSGAPPGLDENGKPVHWKRKHGKKFKGHQRGKKRR